MSARVKSAGPRCSVCDGHCYDVWSTIESYLADAEIEHLSMRDEDGLVTVSGLSEEDARRVALDVVEHHYQAKAEPNAEGRWLVLAAEPGVIDFDDESGLAFTRECPWKCDRCGAEHSFSYELIGNEWLCEQHADAERRAS